MLFLALRVVKIIVRVWLVGRDDDVRNSSAIRQQIEKPRPLFFSHYHVSFIQAIPGFPIELTGEWLQRSHLLAPVTSTNNWSCRPGEVMVSRGDSTG